MRSSIRQATMLAMKYDHTTTARLDVLQAAIEAMFEALAPDAAAAVRAGLAQRLDDLDAHQPDDDAAHAGVAAALLAALGSMGPIQAALVAPPR